MMDHYTKGLVLHGQGPDISRKPSNQNYSLKI